MAYQAAKEVEQALGACSHALHSRLNEASCVESSASSQDDFAGQISQLCAEADSAAARLARVRSGLTRRAGRQGRFSIVLLGRTQAGKSTLREALMGGNGETIGEGAQRTTRNVCEYQWGSCVVVDTPGIGAYDGGRDSEQAMEAAKGADLVVFVISTDGLQNETFRGLAELRRRNIPVVFVLNVRRDLTKAVYRRKFLDAPDTVFRPDELSGHVGRIQRLASEHLGLVGVVVHSLHAQAAFMGFQSDVPDATRLLELSRLDDLTTVIAREVSEKAVIRRLQTTTDAVVCPLDEQRLQTRTRIRQLECDREALQLLAREIVGRSLDRLMDGRDKALRAVDVLANELRSKIESFIEEHGGDADIDEQWRRLVDKHSCRLQADVRRIADATQVEIRKEAEAILAEMAAMPGFAGGTWWGTDLSPRGAGWAGRIRVGGSVLTSVIVTWAPGPFKILTIPVAIGTWVLGKFIDKQWAQWVNDTKAKLRKSVDQWGTQNRRGVGIWFAQAEADMQRELGTVVDARVSLLEGTQADLRGLSSDIAERLQALNCGLVKSVAGLVAAPDPGSLQRVARTPGHRTWVVWHGLEDEAILSEIGDLLDEKVSRGPGRGRAERIAAVLKEGGVESCRVMVDVSESKAHVVFGHGVRYDDLGEDLIALAEDLTDLRIIMQEG